MVSEQDPDAPGEAPDGDEVVESRYRRRVGITLALLAILGASIGLLQTAASSNESAKAREATRLAVEAQTAQVLAEGLDASVRDAFAQVESFESRPVFSRSQNLGEALGLSPDPDLAAQRLATAQQSLEQSFTGRLDLEALGRTAAATELFQKAAVAERIEWNAKASQYETVLTVLAIAVFLVGFTLVLGRKLRPPIAVPGALLALYCLGWAVVIYSHPIPSVDDDAVKQTAAGEVALQRIEGAEAVADFDAALEADPGYVPALSGRALARVVEDNPDLLETLAVTSPDAGTYRGPAGPEHRTGQRRRPRSAHPEHRLAPGAAGGRMGPRGGVPRRRIRAEQHRGGALPLACRARGGRGRHPGSARLAGACP